MRTQTLVKNAIVQIDATPFRQWYHQHYGVEVGLKKRGGPQGGVALEDTTDAVLPSFSLHDSSQTARQRKEFSTVWAV